ncbi:hypothetical protein A7U60_g1159 [Sanghuangporus baumii]|uniref:Uncharacterized protein n=1 Tax=Sanghuangporus baumii TaxID=108892 RepID=A0A9Q5I4M6_SANBA|nr:hypothetical protein A7U60_g1159 [Sanghuangporus baumii]
MRHLAAITLSLYFSLTTLGANIPKGFLQSNGLSLCPSASLVKSTTINLNGNDIQSVTFECPDGSLSASATVPTLATKAFIAAPDSIPGLLRRSASECTQSTPVCQCGQPVGNDCSILIDSLKVIPEAVGPTFTVHTKSFQLLTFQSCAIEWINLSAGSSHEYCWDELAAFSGFADSNCLESGISTGANCTSANDRFSILMFSINP